VEFVLVPFCNERGALGQFGIEPSPDILFIVLVLGQKEPECLLRAKLGDSGEILHPEAIQHLSPFQMSFAQTQGALDGLGRQR
jgi:hypothetical protein